MTVDEAAYEIWEPLGEPTDLAFEDSNGNVNTGSVGWRRLVRALNRGLVATMHHRRERDGRAVRWPGSTEYVSVKVGETTDVTVLAGSTTTALVVAAGSLGDDLYLGWACEVDGTVTLVASNDGTTVYLSEALDEVPTVGDAITLRKPYAALEGVETVLRVTSTADGRDLELVRPESIGWTPSVSYGDPASYYQVGQRLYVDPIPEEAMWLRCEVETHPTVTGTVGEDLPIPEALHDAVVLWCLGWGMRRYVNAEMMMVYRREFERALATIQLPEDNILDRADDRFGVATS